MMHSDVAVERGLRAYVERVAETLGQGPACALCEVADAACAYVALDQRLPSWPERDVALIWEQRHGWAVCVETHSGEDLLVVAYQGPPQVPEPELVAGFAKGVFAEPPRAAQLPPWLDGDGLWERLASYAPTP